MVVRDYWVRDYWAEPATVRNVPNSAKRNRGSGSIVPAPRKYPMEVEMSTMKPIRGFVSER